MSRYVDGVRARRALPGTRRRDRIAFVLSGGGVLGAVQVGQLEGLLGAGIVPDLLVGTSVGALNAAAVAADPTPEGVGVLRAVWAELRGEDLFPGGRVHRARQLLKGDHLYPNSGIRRLIEHLPARSFDGLARPLSVSAVNLRTGRERWFEDGQLDDALLASTALPGIFPPVGIDGELYVDGGVVDNVPIARAVDLGATQVYVLTCGPQPTGRPIRRPLDVLMQAVVHSRAARVELEVERYGSRASIVMVPTFDTGAIRFNDTSHSVRLMEHAAELTRSFLAHPAVSSRRSGRRAARARIAGEAAAQAPA